MTANESLLHIINEESLKFVQTFVAQRKAALQKRKANVSGELLRSLEFDVVKNATRQAVDILIAFNDEGRIIDMRQSSIHYDGLPLIDRLKIWVEKKGVNGFLNGYKDRRKYYPRDYNKLLTSIAWGIAINRSKGKFKRKTWWNKAKTAAIADLVNKIAAALPDPVLDNLKKEIKKP